MRTITNRALQTKRVLTNDLRNFIKSKDDRYCILAIEGQLQLPAYDECSMEFLKDALRGQKLLLHNSEVR